MIPSSSFSTALRGIACLSLRCRGPSSSIPSASLIRYLSSAVPAKPAGAEAKAASNSSNKKPPRINRVAYTDLSASAVLEQLKTKCQGKSLPRLSEFHTLLMKSKSTADKEAVLGGLDLFLYKNIEFREETTSHFFRALLRADAMAEAVDTLLDRQKRLGIWSSRRTIHMALYKLGTMKDWERLLKVYEAMPSLGIVYTARTIHLVVRGLKDADQGGAKALEIAAKHKEIVLADSTKELLKEIEASSASAKGSDDAAAGQEAAEASGAKKEVTEEKK